LKEVDKITIFTVLFSLVTPIQLFTPAHQNEE
jgi:hypothetical protein